MKPRDRLVLGILALAGLVAALWLGVVAPKREQATGLGTKVTAAEQRRDAANTKLARADQARASYSRDYATVARLGKAIPTQADLSSLVYQLESAARDAKVDFRSVSFQDAPAEAPTSDGAKASPDGKAAPSSTAGIEPVLFSIMFEGRFLKLHQLLRSVDRFSRLKGKTIKVSGRLLTLDAVKLSPGRRGFPQVKAEITARAYTAPIPAELPAGGAASAPTSPDPSPATRVVP